MMIKNMNASTTTPAVEAPITTFTNLAARKKWNNESVNIIKMTLLMLTTGRGDHWILKSYCKLIKPMKKTNALL